jgi:hypothetical protein
MGLQKRGTIPVCRIRDELGVALEEDPRRGVPELFGDPPGFSPVASMSVATVRRAWYMVRRRMPPRFRAGYQMWRRSVVMSTGRAS